MRPKLLAKIIGFFKTVHNLILGLLPRKQRLAYLHWRMLGDWPDLHNPRRFNEKLCWRKLYDHNPLFPVTADKVLARDFIADRIGPQYLTRIYGVFDDPDQIDFASLPDAFVLKANHGCGWIRLVPDKSSVDWPELKALAKSWLAQRYGRLGGEWWYDVIQPMLMIEEFLRDKEGKPPDDYRFWVFGGEVAMVQVDIDKFSNWHRNYYDTRWRQLPQVSSRIPQGGDIPRPATFDTMVALASKLGTDFDFVRVDLCHVPGRIVFGEMTHCSGSGWAPFSDPSFDEWLGQLMKLPREPYLNCRGASLQSL